MHAPFADERILLLFADLIGDFKCDLSWRFACDLSSSPLTPSCHQRFSVVYTVCLLTPKYSAMEATDHPESMKLHNVVTTLRRIRGVIKEREAAHLDRWRRARCQHGLDRMMRGTPMKARVADLCNLTDGHVRHFHT